MSNKLKRKALIPALAMVLVSIVALSGVSYAWFQLGNTATVDKLDFKVQAASGIQISLTPTDATSWKSTITADDLSANVRGVGSSTNAYPCVEAGTEVRILPVSTTGEVVDGQFSMYKGTILSKDVHNVDITLDGKLRSEKEAQAGANANLIAFDLYIKADSAQMISLANGTGIARSTTSEKESEMAVRMGMINYGTAATPTAAVSLSTEKSGGTNTLLSTGSFIWEPYATKHLDSTDTSVLAYKGLKKTGEGIDVSNGVAIDADYLGANNVVTRTDLGDEITDANKADLVEIGAGITKLRIYVWLEGQDADCLNQISGGDLVASIVFERRSLGE